MHRAPEPADEGSSRRSRWRGSCSVPHMSVQAPPNLSDEAQRLRLLDAGINDWGGVSPLTPDHVNPERPWPQIEALAATTAARGKQLRERLAIYPGTPSSPIPGLRAKMRAPIAALLGAEGLAVEGQRPEPIAWQDPESPRSPGPSRSRSPRRTAPASAPMPTPSTGTSRRQRGHGAWAAAAVAPARLDAEIRDALRAAAPARPLSDDQALALFRAEGQALDALCRVADDLRAEAVGPEVTYVINRNINFTNVCYVGLPLLRLRAAGGRRRVVHADAGGGRGPCGGGVDRRRDGGLHARRDPSGPARHLLRRLIGAVKARVPGMHVHAFSPMEIMSGAAKPGVSHGEFLAEAPGRGPRHDARNGGRDPR